MAKQKYKKPVKKRGISICTGCIEEFKNVDLTVVRLEQSGGMIYSTVFCEKCVKKEQFPHHIKYTIVGQPHNQENQEQKRQLQRRKLLQRKK